MKAALRKGWCPSVLRPMMSGDGLVVRLGQKASVLSPQEARTLAGLAQCCGNGLLDLTSRGHLQFRGVTETSLPLLQARLHALGFVEAKNEDAAAPTVMTNALAGLDPSALIDSRPLASASRARLSTSQAMSNLPPKFCFAIDDGGLLSIAGEKSDIAFVPVRFAGAVKFVVNLGGVCVGECARDDIPEVALRLAQAFLDLRGAGVRAAQRMGDLVSRLGAPAVLRLAAVATLAFEVPAPKRPQPIGRFRLGALHALGVGVPFGRLDGTTLSSLADVAEESRGELRLTPWRAVLLLGARQPDSGVLQAAGLILDANNPLRAVAACPGVSGCMNGTTATQADARQIATIAQRLGTQGVVVHVSGCEKGCAHAAPAPVTFVGREGLYDMVINGGADQAPVRHGLRPSELTAALRDLMRDAPRTSP